MFSQSNNVVVTGGQFTHTIQQRNSGIERLGSASAPAAIHNSEERFNSSRCRPNTRVTVLDQIMRWILAQENSEALIMWLFGSAGTGKSAISQTIAERCYTLQILLASFFFSRADPSRNHPRSLLPTIAYQVVINFPDSRDIITRVPEQDPLVLTQSFDAQLTSLIIRPLQQLYLAGRRTGSPDPYLIIIDGLDECADPQVQVSILRSVSKALKQCQFPLRFLISSRPELHLTAEFNSSTTNPILSRVALDNKFVLDNDDTITPPPLPPPPPLRFPFNNSKPKRRFSWSSAGSHVSLSDQSIERKMVRHPSFSLASTSDSEKYDDVPLIVPARTKDEKIPKLGGFFNTTNGMTSPSKWGYGWGVGKKEKASMNEKSSSQPNLPLPQPIMGRDSTSIQASRSTHRTQAGQQTKSSQQSKESYRSSGSRSTVPKPRPPLLGHGLYPQGLATLVGSVFERKINNDVVPFLDTTDHLQELRRLMAKDSLDYYIVLSEDSHDSEYVATRDKQLEFISRFTGTSGRAIITRKSAYLFTDSQYWSQAQEEIDHNWTLVRCGLPGAPQDWIEWFVARVRRSRIGLDARTISYEKATLLQTQIQSLQSKFIFPPQNLVDLVWVEKPERTHAMVHVYSMEFAGEGADSKLARLREWIRQQPASIASDSKQQELLPSQVHIATLVTSLSCIAYLLNLRGSDIPYNPLFHAYLFVSLQEVILFVDSRKLHDEVVVHLDSIAVQHRNYIDVWEFLRRREWGEGKVLIAPQTSYAISLMLTNFRYMIAPSYIERMMSIKNQTEVEGMTRAYLRDGVSFVRFLAWLESKIAAGYDITEYEAAFKLTEIRREHKAFIGLAYENISASGPNAALPLYTPKKLSASMISLELPYLNNSGAHYCDGTCSTTRTVHFGRPSSEMCEAYTHVLRVHIAIDSAIFPKGTSGQQLDLLAHKPLWKDGLKDLPVHGTDRGFGSFLTVLEDRHGFASGVPLVPGNVVTNKPSFYLEGKWGIRTESALVVKKVKRGESNGDVWLGFDRLTCVPIQTKMVKESMLTKEEKQWLKGHNQQCYEKLSPFLKDDKRALKWLKRAAGIVINWS